MFSFDSGNDDVDNETHVENVTVQMTSNLNNTTRITYDEADAVDFNENQTNMLLNNKGNSHNRNVQT